MDPEQQAENIRSRPVVLQARGADAESARRSPARYFAWAGTGMIGLAAAVGLVAGGTAVWSAFDPGTPGKSPAPLWVTEPATIQPQAATVTSTPDDHGGRRDDPTGPPTFTASHKSTTEPGDDKGGSGKTSAPTLSGSKSTTEPGDDKGGSRKTSAPTSTGSSRSTTEPGDDKGGSRKSASGSTDTSGKGSDDKSGHR
jgi:hypothetical protein